MALREFLILRSLRSGRLEGRTVADPVAYLLRLTACALIVVLAALPARAEDLATVVSELGGASFAAKEKAIVALGKLGDPLAVPILQALSDDRLRRAPDGSVVLVARVGGATKLLDAASGRELSDVPPDSLERIIVNNRLRGLIEAALGTLTLFSPDRDARLAAAQNVLKHPSADKVALLDKAMAAEEDAEIRASMQLGLFAVHLFAGSRDEQLAAIRALAGTTDPQVKSLIDEFRYKPDLDPELRKAADDALASINNRLRLNGLAASLFEGISLGSVLLLAAIGLAITFGVMGVINMAHGEMVMLGAYTTYVVQEVIRARNPALFDYSLFIAIPLAFLISGLVGILVERCIIRFLYGRPLETLLATWGLSLIMQQAVRTSFGPTNKDVGTPSWMSGAFEVGGMTITYNRLWIIVFTLAVFVALLGLLRFTRLGLEMRAVTQNRAMAASMGIRTSRIDALTFGLGSGIAGIAGVALSQIDNVSPNLGQGYIIDSFMVVVFGGVGNLWGTLVGAFTLGVANKFLEPYAGAVLGKILILVLIILFIQKRPRGLFALRGRAVEA